MLILKPENNNSKTNYQIPDLSTKIKVSDCLSCSKIFTLNDPKGLCSHQFESFIRYLYFSLSDEFYTLGFDDEGLWREGLKIVKNGLNKINSDIENQENVYELFLKNKSNLSGNSEYYSKEYFYTSLRIFFDFLVDYWSSVERSIREMLTSNSEEEYSELRKENTFLLIALRTPSYLIDIHNTLEEERGNMIPYELSFKFRGKNSFLRNYGDLGSEEVRKLNVLGKERKINKKAKIKNEQEKAYQRGAEKAQTGIPLEPGDDLEFLKKNTSHQEVFLILMIINLYYIKYISLYFTESSVLLVDSKIPNFMRFWLTKF